MTDLQKAAGIVGGMLLAASVLFLTTRNDSGAQRAEPEDNRHVDELADTLREAWAGYHNR